MIALSTTYSFVLFSSLNNLKTASLTGIPRAGKETFLGERLFLSHCLLPYILQDCPLAQGQEGQS